MEAILKLFGTGQLTIPKAMRERYETKEFKATDTDEGIVLKPVKTLVLEDSDPNLTPEQLEQDLKKAGHSQAFIKDLVNGYAKSNFYNKHKK